MILAVETSCDDTCAAVVTRDGDIHSNVVASQGLLHRRYGGVVPEIASRRHLEAVGPVIDDALERAQVPLERITLVAATRGPGLIGALLVGLSAAKALAAARGLPFVPVDHLHGHVVSATLGAEPVEPPYLSLVASGGHTFVARVDDPATYQVLGRTLDDSAGEAFDKGARLLGLGYPGGPAIDREAMRGDPDAIRFPRALLDESASGSGTGEHALDFSFSGLKTSVINHVRKHPDVATADVCASFQEAVVDVLVAKARRAAKEVSATGMALGGGVAANSLLRERFLDACTEIGVHGFLPSRAMCTDNAAMVAAAAWFRLRDDGPTPLDAGADPNLGLR